MSSKNLVSLLSIQIPRAVPMHSENHDRFLSRSSSNHMVNAHNSVSAVLTSPQQYRPRESGIIGFSKKSEWAKHVSAQN